MASSSAGAVGSSSFGGDKREKMLVAAIDIGETFSGYAFSFKADYDADPVKVSTNMSWVAGSMSLISLKTPTCVLFNENQEFHSFGFEAENFFKLLELDGDHEKCYFFKRFKMPLYGKKVNRDVEVRDFMGRRMPAKKVFGEVIRYLKNHLLTFLQARGPKVENRDFHLVLTVPAIWSDSAKQFMREAAYVADIDGGQLSIVLEPEAASLYCQMLPVDKIHGSDSADFAVATPGSKFMVIDLGGCTAEITVHERQPDGGLRELHKPEGGPWGGTKVDDAFFQLIVKIVGAPVFKKFQTENLADFIDLQRELETKKRTITSATSGKITVKLPVSIEETYMDETGESIKDAIDSSPFKDKLTWTGFRLRMDAELFKGLFKECVDEIVKKVRHLLNESKVKGTKIVLIVGGFSESAFVQEQIRKALPGCIIIIPEEAGLAVLKGAVIYGHRSSDCCKKYRAYVDFL